MSNVTELMTKLDSLYEDRRQLHHDLHKSLTIQELWPDAFVHGRCSSQVKGNLRNKDLPLTFILKLGNGEKRYLPLEEVPTILWPEKLKAEIRKLGPFSGNRFYKLLKQGEDNAKKS